eukprot:GFUD01028651.1.p1 GENE.GFUD01028651.1~~GFUD01028651.1.p1  ORF type:complete len:271 (+),score=56.09 GFUD01028651.1:62-814(+)
MGSDRRDRSRSRERRNSPSRDRRDRSRSKDKRNRERSKDTKRERRADGDAGQEKRRQENKNDGGRWEDKDTQYGLEVPEAKVLVTEATEEVEKEGINLGLSGALTEDSNTFNGIVIKYAEPPEARKPKRRWRFYVFKGSETLPTLHLHRQSAYLMGRDRKVCDLPIDHPSCSKQHAAFQYRMISRKKDDGTEANRVLPYVIDLGSANGTFLNNNKIESKRYYELKEKDVLKFGFSTREYVLLHENSGEDD